MIDPKELRALALFAEDSDEAIAWMAERFTVQELAEGEVLVRVGDPCGRGIRWGICMFARRGRRQGYCHFLG